MVSRLFLILMLATACAATTSHAQPSTAQNSAQRAQALAGVRSKLSQLRAEQDMNKAALGNGPSDEDRDRLNVRAYQIASTIAILRAQEIELAKN
jgi:hypothetical protein